MPWCPQCKTEYRPGVTHCADCGCPLVEQLPQEEICFSGEPVLLTEVTHDAEAVLITQLLEDNGIPVLRHGCNEADHLSMLYTGATLCGQKLYVSADQLSRAKELIQVYQGTKGQFLYDADAFTQVSPDSENNACDGRSKQRLRWGIRLLIILVISIPIGLISPALGLVSFLLLFGAAFVLP